MADKPEPVQVATLKSAMGKGCFQVYKHLPLTDEQRGNAQYVLQALGEHFQPKTNLRAIFIQLL